MLEEETNAHLSILFVSTIPKAEGVGLRFEVIIYSSCASSRSSSSLRFRGSPTSSVVTCSSIAQAWIDCSRVGPGCRLSTDAPYRAGHTCTDISVYLWKRPTDLCALRTSVGTVSPVLHYLRLMRTPFSSSTGLEPVFGEEVNAC